MARVLMAQLWGGWRCHGNRAGVTGDLVLKGFKSSGWCAILVGKQYSDGLLLAQWSASTSIVPAFCRRRPTIIAISDLAGSVLNTSHNSRMRPTIITTGTLADRGGGRAKRLYCVPGLCKRKTQFSQATHDPHQWRLR